MKYLISINIKIKCCNPKCDSEATKKFKKYFYCEICYQWVKSKKNDVK